MTVSVRELCVRDLMSSDLVTLHRAQSLSLAEETMKIRRIRHLPVVDDDFHLVGLVTHRDILAAKVSILPRLGKAEQSSLELAVPVSNIMQTDIWTVEPTMAADKAAKMLHDHKFGCLPVVLDARLVGIVTEADFLRLIAESLALGDPPLPKIVEDAMTVCSEIIEAGDTLEEARTKLRQARARQLPVLEDGIAVGILSGHDLAMARTLATGARSDGGAAASAEGRLVRDLVSHRTLVTKRTAHLDPVLLDMAAQEIEVAIVLEDDRPIGLLTAIEAARMYALDLRKRAKFPGAR